MNIEKWFRKWLEARNDQHTATKAWSEYIVNCNLIELDSTCDRKPLPYIDIKIDQLEPHNLKVVQYVFLLFKVAESGQQIETTKVIGLMGR